MRITTEGAADQTLHPGDFAWIEEGSSARKIEGMDEKDIRFVEIFVKP
jgi:hypothetical protein